MQLKIYQVDAFTDNIFGGNPAAVIPLEHWLSKDLMQLIALENNLSETVFFVSNQTGFDIRWFTPEVEINLCGHATLASAFILFEKLGYKKDSVVFQSASGPLTVTKKDGMLMMDFPSWEPKELEAIDPNLSTVLGDITILETHQYRDILIVLENETAVQHCQPDFTLMKKHFNKMIITAKGDEVDFVSRFFAPAAGINEDPVTGSAHSQLIPFWAKRLNKTTMNAKQLSKRGGTIYCEQNGERVVIGGNCVFYMEGEISINNKQ